MALELSKEEIAQIIPSVQKYFREELEQELSALRAKFLVDYFLKEIGPCVYNKGVSDAEAYLRARVEDLPGLCFEEGLTYWRPKRK